MSINQVCSVRCLLLNGEIRQRKMERVEEKKRRRERERWTETHCNAAWRAELRLLTDPILIVLIVRV